MTDRTNTPTAADMTAGGATAEGKLARAWGWWRWLLFVPILVVLSVLYGRLLRAFDTWLPGDLNEAQLVAGLILVVPVTVMFYWVVPKLIERRGGSGASSCRPEGQTIENQFPLTTTTRDRYRC